MIKITVITRIVIIVLAVISSVIIVKYIIDQARKTQEAIRQTLIGLNSAVPNDKCEILQRLGLPCDAAYKQQQDEFRMMLQKADLDYHDVENLASALNLSRYDANRIVYQRL